MERTFEQVYAVTDYWDGPREGVADYGGVPHVFRAVFCSATDDWDADRYYLHRLNQEQAAIAAEDWLIWRRFAEHYRGRVAPAPTDPADWGALPEDLPRKRELRTLLAAVFTLDATQCIVARAEFRSCNGPTGPGPVAPSVEVRWTLAAPEPGDRLVPSPAV